MTRLAIHSHNFRITLPTQTLPEQQDSSHKRSHRASRTCSKTTAVSQVSWARKTVNSSIRSTKVRPPKCDTLMTWLLHSSKDMLACLRTSIGHRQGTQDLAKAHVCVRATLRATPSQLTKEVAIARMQDQRLYLMSKTRCLTETLLVQVEGIS